MARAGWRPGTFTRGLSSPASLSSIPAGFFIYPLLFFKYLTKTQKYLCYPRTLVLLGLLGEPGHRRLLGVSLLLHPGRPLQPPVTLELRHTHGLGAGGPREAGVLYRGDARVQAEDGAEAAGVRGLGRGRLVPRPIVLLPTGGRSAQTQVAGNPGLVWGQSLVVLEKVPSEGS